MHAVLPNIPPYVSYSWLAMGVLIGVALVVRNKLSLVPSGLQNIMETFADFALNLSRDNIGHRWGDKFYPLIGTVFLYIMTCNFFGLIPGFDAPTSNINMTASMAVPVFLIYQFYGIKVHGFKYINHFLGPIRSIYALPLMVMMFFIEVIGHFVRPITLSVRLFGNMMAKHTLMIILGILAPAIIPVAILGLGVLVSVVQAFVFTLLTTLYLAGAVEEGH
ncbi:MAG: ATP synthase F0 subunit A [Nitrospirae bacterium GWB2_47_37]|nr:MAG: ATP synthase F0 subunit A [Nitrospirae bacterium GWA2_46_11]OGW24997.1 MAG: ATP synthase F0 subunit A [Nitrospirae bacterium GWB2_47_37]